MANHGKPKNVPELLREPLEAAQQRLGAFEEEAQRVLKDLIEKGRASRKDFSQMVQRLSKQDLHLDDLKGRWASLRDQGLTRANELRGKAESFRSEALHRLEDLQARAVAFLGVATQDQVEKLSREIDRLSKRLDPRGKSTGKKVAKKNGKTARA